jgi:hypothetical protein
MVNGQFPAIAAAILTDTAIPLDYITAGEAD